MTTHRIQLNQYLREYLEWGGFPEVVLSTEKQATNNANAITFNSLSTFLNVSVDTIDKFSDYFARVYMVEFLRRFSFKVKEQEKSPRKVYCVDTGLANAVGFRFSENIGRLAESIVFWHLCRVGFQNPGTELYYWKDDQHREIDFIVKTQLKINQAIQVCWNLDDPKTKRREIKSRLKGMAALKLKEALIITETHEGAEKIEGMTIHYQPIIPWLLEH